MTLRFQMPGLPGSFLRGRRGSFAVAAGLMMSLVFGVGMFAFEIARIDRARGGLQEAADAAAIAAAHELPILGGSEPAMTAVARGVAEMNLGIVSDSSPPAPKKPADGMIMARSMAQSDDGGGGDDGDGGDALQVRATLLPDGDAVRIDLRRRAPMVFGSLVNSNHPWVVATATGEVYGELKICVIALEETTISGIRMTDTARISGKDCGIFANSRNSKALHLHDTAFIDSTTLCTGGGYEGGEVNFGTMPITDCPPQPDPLATRNVPASRTCTFSERVVVGAGSPPGAEHRAVEGPGPWTVLKPGVYCGGIEVPDGMDVWFDPGTYVIHDGTLTFSGASRARGRQIAFHFSGVDAKFEILDTAEIRFAAPTGGRLAGILFYENGGGSCPQAGAPNAAITISLGGAGDGLDYNGVDASCMDHVIRSPNVKELIGTIYLPDDRLVIKTDQPVAEESAFTVLIVNQLNMVGAPNLVLNTDYDASNVPIPEGVVLPLDHARLKR